MMDPHPLREMISDHSCKNCRYPERGCVRYMRLDTCQEFQPNDDATYREIVRLRIAHLRRMVQATCAAEERALKNFRICMTRKSIRYSIRERQIVGKLDRFRSACLAKITELKESQCSTKS